MGKVRILPWSSQTQDDHQHDRHDDDHHHRRDQSDDEHRDYDDDTITITPSS